MMTLLQINGGIEEVTKLSKASIELAEAASNFGALKVIFGVFLIMMLIIIVTFVAQSMFILKKVQRIADASERVLAYFKPLSERTLGEDESCTMMREVMNHCSVLIKYSIIRVRLENHINNEQNTEVKLRRVISNCYIEASSFLGKFIVEGKGKPISNVLDISSDGESIYELMREQVYAPKEEYTVSSMDQTVELFFNGLKLNYISKLEKL